MWQKKNPYLEYAIALLRGQKEGIHNGIVKTEAQRKANRLWREQAVAASDAEAIRGPKLDEWSARIPAYAYTSLCPDERYRR